MENCVRVRFAPSPTGHLHIGGVRTALFNYLFARHSKGTFILRIEDTDTSRSTEESIEQIIKGLQWMGIDWDEGPFRQTERKEIYQFYLEKLLKEGKAYRCYCSQQELDEMRKKALATGEKPRYNRKCRDLTNPPKNSSYVIRFRTPFDGEIKINDFLRGNVNFLISELDDLIIARSDGSPTYNFVVVVDDAEMKITHVIRGDDHLTNAPRQALLYQGLNLPSPRFVHVPMILGSDKARLSKRHGATSILAYKDMGYLPQAMMNYLVRLGWSAGDQEIFSKEEMIDKFNLENLNKSAAVFNPDKLLWLNQHYIKESKPSALVSPLKDFLVSENIVSPGKNFKDKDMAKVIASLLERSKTLIEMAHGAKYYFIDEIIYEESAAKKHLKPDIVPIFKVFLEKIKSFHDELTNVNLEPIFNEIISQHNIKFGKIAQPLRVALTGKTVSPGIFDVMVVLGKSRVLKLLGQAIDAIEAHSHGNYSGE